VRQGWLGVDIGTTSTKAVVYDDRGRPIGAARVPTHWSTVGAHVDIDPAVLLAGAIRAANDAVTDAVDRDAQGDADVQIAGIGLASMGETGVLVDSAGRPVSPAIAWHDQRDGAEVAALAERIGRSAFERRTGKPLRSQFALTKHRWLVDHEPAARTAVRRFNVAEWVARGLGADECCELSLAGRTGWYNLFEGQWDAELLAWSGTAAAMMPPLVAAGTPIGAITSEAADARLRGAVVTLCGHDHQSAAVGCGAENAGDELDSCGTAEALVRTVPPLLGPDEVERLTRAGITVDVSIQPERWSLLGGTQGGLVMQRVLGLLGVDRKGLSALDAAALDPAALHTAALDPASLHAASLDAAALDAAGLTVAVEDGAVRLSVTGDVTPSRLWRSVVDAVTAEAAELHETISSVVGPPGRIIATGGWCRSAMVLDAKRRLLGDVTLADVAEPGTFGAAILAARAAGHLSATGRFDSGAVDKSDDRGDGP
jgi:sugar (pentulose or hexulose) kinase